VIRVYVIVVVPADTPPIASLAEPVVLPGADTLAISALADDHVPESVREVDVSESVVVKPWHTLSDPVMDTGSGFTVTAPVTKQPAGSV
jgi:hypothetical protein